MFHCAGGLFCSLATARGGTGEIGTADDESDDDQQEGTLARDLRELRERQEAGEKAGKAGKMVKGAKKAARKEEEEESASGSDNGSSAESGSDSDDEDTFEARRCLACPKVILLSLSAVADHIKGKVRCVSIPSQPSPPPPSLLAAKPASERAADVRRAENMHER